MTTNEFFVGMYDGCPYVHHQLVENTYFSHKPTKRKILHEEKYFFYDDIPQDVLNNMSKSDRCLFYYLDKGYIPRDIWVTFSTFEMGYFKRRAFNYGKDDDHFVKPVRNKTIL